MKIFTGIFDHMVMQRDSNNFSYQKIEGKTDANLEVVAKCYNEKGNVIGEEDHEAVLRYCKRHDNLLLSLS